MRPFTVLFGDTLLQLRPAAELARQTLRPAPRRAFHSFQVQTNTRWSSGFKTVGRQSSAQQAARARPLRQQRRWNSSKNGEGPSPNPTAHLGSPPAAPSLSQRLRNMSREYGWTALGVYLALSALDFPFCVLAVRMLGVERIGHWEHVIVRGFWDTVSVPFPGGEEQVRAAFRTVGHSIKSALQAVGIRKADEQPAPAEGMTKTKDGEWTWGVEEAQEEAEKEGATLATQLALAYAVHKSFIFLRVPLTAAVLPRVVKTLRGWGWNIGKKAPKAASTKA